jgi:hypothetical protein
MAIGHQFCLLSVVPFALVGDLNSYLRGPLKRNVSMLSVVPFALVGDLNSYLRGPLKRNVSMLS